jgi:hypothetical protein
MGGDAGNALTVNVNVKNGGDDDDGMMSRLLKGRRR